ncbi:MAG: T9SS type A sorting domain-containing protein [Kaistella sp.]|nr:T9SS type A sorting domain-containing protein [Kaistella sp.]
MKKLLLSGVLTFAFAFSNGQILQQENFEALNLGTAIGQGAPAYALFGGAAADYTIITSGTSKVLQISVPATVDAYRYMWKDGLDVAWSARTSGNNIFQVEYDYFTGPASTSDNGGGVEVIDVPAGKVFAGLSVHHATKTVLGMYTTTAGVNSSTNLGAGATPAAVVLPPNTWVRMGFAYNSANGTITYKGPGFSKVITGTLLTSPAEIDYAGYDLTGTNAASSVHLIDNMVSRAVATETLLLGTSDVSLASKDISIYPNPAKDFINVSSKVKILAAYIYDMSGIRMDANMEDGKVNVKNLQTGTYLLGLKTDKGLVTKQFIKK